MKKTFLTFFFILLNIIVFAQVPSLTFEWIKQFGNNLTDVNVYDIKNDQYGNVYFCGSFNGTLTLQDSSIVSVDNNNDIFFAKLDPAGNLLWLRHIGGIGFDVATSLAIDTIDNTFYVAGTFYQKIIFGNDTLAANTYNDFFLVKYDYYGNYLWTTSGGSINLPVTVAIDKNQNIVLVSQYDQNLVIGDTILIYPSIGNGLFIVKYGKNGIRLLAKLLTEYEQYNTGKNIVIDNNNNIIICSNGGQIITTDTLAPSTIYIIKYDSNGVYQWALPYGENFYVQSHANSIVIDKSDNIYFTGIYIMNQEPGIHSFFCKVSPSGHLLWGRLTTGSAVYFTLEAGLNLLTHNDTTIFVTLHLDASSYWIDFFGTYIFDNGLYIAQFDSSGNKKSIKEFAKGGGSTTSQLGLIFSMLTANVYFASTFGNPIYLNDTSYYVSEYYSNIIISKVGSDILLNEKNEKNSYIKNYSIYPNPAEYYIEISITPITENFVVEIFNIYGQQKIVSTEQSNEIAKINIKNFQQGLYLVRITDIINKVVYQDKFVKY